jgi:hypothetical protein
VVSPNPLLGTALQPTIPAGGGTLLINVAISSATKDASAGNVTFEIEVGGAPAFGITTPFAANQTSALPILYETATLAAGVHSVNVNILSSAGVVTVTGQVSVLVAIA